jgi:hypothetical protein
MDCPSRRDPEAEMRPWGGLIYDRLGKASPGYLFSVHDQPRRLDAPAIGSGFGLVRGARDSSE